MVNIKSFENWVTNWAENYLRSAKNDLGKLGKSGIEAYISSALEMKDLDMFKKGINHPQLDIYFSGGIIIDRICSNGLLDFFNVIEKHADFDITFDSCMCLTAASLRGHLELVKQILAYEEVSPIAKNSHPIRMAIAADNFQITKLLLDDPRTDTFQVVQDLFSSDIEENSYVQKDMGDYLAMVDPSLKSLVDTNKKMKFL